MLVSVSRSCHPAGMGKKRGILLAVLVVALLGGLAWLVLRPHEPVYQGKSLSAWLEQYSERYVEWPPGSGSLHALSAWQNQHRGSSPALVPDPNSPARLEAANAIRQIGTNGLPLLWRLISARDSPLTKQLLAHRTNPWLMRLLPHLRLASHDHQRGLAGFFILGTMATPAVPALVALVNDPDPGVRATAVSVLVQFGPEAQAAVPALLKCLNDPRSWVRTEAMLCLGNIHAQPELVVPVMIDYLQGPAPATPIRYYSVVGIGNFGAQAKPAVPTLLRLLDDEDARIRSLVTNSLLGIDPAAAARAGVK
jgi:HEAT repeat protein